TQVEKFRNIPLSDSTVARRIENISSWLEAKVCGEIRSSPMWALQLDESTDVSGSAILLVLVRYVFECDVHEELLLCKSLKSNATGEAIFNVIDAYLKENGVPWDTCINICTDGAAAMVGHQKGVVGKVKKVSPDTTASHCIIHREMLAMRKLPWSLETALTEAVKIVNYIKTRPLQSRLFKIMCDEMGSSHSSLLLHTEVRWLSRGRVLNRLFELRKELMNFSLDSPFNLCERLRDSQWLKQLAYLADMFNKLNELNLCLQRRSVTIFDVTDRITAMKRKMELWAELISEDRLDFLPTLQDYLRETDETLDESIKHDIHDHLLNLRDSLEKYFPSKSMEDQIAHKWIKNPSSASLDRGLSACQNEELIELQNNSQLKQLFLTTSLAKFWASVNDNFPLLSNLALRTLVPFVSTYLCERGFSAYIATKNKYRNRLDAEPDMRLQLSNRTPNFAEILSGSRNHPSHRSHPLVWLRGVFRGSFGVLSGFHEK
ncbi:zinc finger BED domain-containing protein 5-like, partial [Galendromus occidentalis]|uniref:Zinc finger BED domain-containing protein 5-like n=1 Tax=Galendromus occidentalis TaxID=34638 RepID=A0AAJ6VWA1_9ACAR